VDYVGTNGWERQIVQTAAKADCNETYADTHLIAEPGSCLPDTAIRCIFFPKGGYSRP
jgi:hypothetical protein